MNEDIEIVKYNPEWPKLFIQETQNIKGIFEPKRLLDIEHYGSTSVPSLSAKPIIDILVGLDEFYLSEQEKTNFENLGYLYFGKAATSQRFFLRKRNVQKFNLAVVLYKGPVWCENLLVCEYLRNHPSESKKYTQVKMQAIKEGHANALDYSEFKCDFVMQLVKKAKSWGSKNFHIKKYLEMPKKCITSSDVNKKRNYYGRSTCTY